MNIDVKAHLACLTWSGFAAALAFAVPASAKPEDVISVALRSADHPLPMVVHLSQEKLLVGRDTGNSYQIDGGLMGMALQSILSGGAEKAMSPSLDAFSRNEAEQTLTRCGKRHGRAGHCPRFRRFRPTPPVILW